MLTDGLIQDIPPFNKVWLSSGLPYIFFILCPWGCMMLMIPRKELISTLWPVSSAATPVHPPAQTGNVYTRFCQWAHAWRIPISLSPCHTQTVLRDPEDLLPDVHVEVTYKSPTFKVFIFPWKHCRFSLIYACSRHETREDRPAVLWYKGKQRRSRRTGSVEHSHQGSGRLVRAPRGTPIPAK